MLTPGPLLVLSCSSPAPFLTPPDVESGADEVAAAAPPHRDALLGRLLLLLLLGRLLSQLLLLLLGRLACHASCRA